MNLTARMPSVVSSSTSSNPGMTSYGYQDPGKSVASDDRSGKPENASQPGYSKEDYGRSWSSQEWKSGAAEHDRSGKPEKPTMNLVSRYSARDPNVLASTASESPEKTKSESQVPLCSWNEQQPRTGRLVVGACSSGYSKKDN